MPAIWDAKGGGLEIESHPQRHREFRTGLPYTDKPTTVTTKNAKEAFRHSLACAWVPCFGHHKTEQTHVQSG